MEEKATDWKREEKRLKAIIEGKLTEESIEPSPEAKRLQAIIYNELLEDPEELSSTFQTLKIQFQQLLHGNLITFPKVIKLPGWAATATA